jgi:hypothetical protein
MALARGDLPGSPNVAGPEPGAAVPGPEPEVAGGGDPAPGPVDGRVRDPRLAASLSALPGLGQAYNGQGGKAGFFSLSVLLTIGPAVLLIMLGERVGTQLLRDQRGALFLLFAFVSIVVFLGLFLLGLTFWASSIFDARRSAQELNRGDPAAASRWWFFRL